MCGVTETAEGIDECDVPDTSYVLTAAGEHIEAGGRTVLTSSGTTEIFTSSLSHTLPCNIPTPFCLVPMTCDQSERQTPSTARRDELIGTILVQGAIPVPIPSPSLGFQPCGPTTRSPKPLSLDRIRIAPAWLEDTIIVGLIERAQYPHNTMIYQKGFEELRGSDCKGICWFFTEAEALHGAFA